jgi:excisionase family DNA binding protein
VLESNTCSITEVDVMADPAARNPDQRERRAALDLLLDRGPALLPLLLLDVDEVAGLLGTRRAVVRRLVRNGELPACTVGRRTKVSTMGLYEFIAELRATEPGRRRPEPSTAGEACIRIQLGSTDDPAAKVS